ncbi:MAG: LysR family transcriptional regulator [Rhodospirillaceae bacterium]
MTEVARGRDGVLAWDDLRLVLAVAETGALSRAAAALGIRHPTLSRRLSDIERRLDCRLVERSPQACKLTAAGEDVCALARRIAEDVGALERRIVGRDGGEQGLVRVTAPDAVSEYMLPGILAGLTRELPAITVELVVSNQPLSLAQRAADLALRVTDDPDPALKGRRVAAIGFAVYRVAIAGAGAVRSEGALGRV